MKIPLSLIQSFVSVDLPPSQIAEILTLLGLEVDGIIDDSVFEISLTPNLGHCMSALGVARELAASLQLPLKLPEVHPLVGKEYPVTVHDPDLVPRYSLALIEGVQVGPSPAWLKSVLEESGQKSINHVVDITNYIMLKFGQPLHAFDADKIVGDVQVGLSSGPFLGLDGVEREVSKNGILISDAKGPIAIAGIMGGAHSAVSDKTTRVLLESAYFDPISVRNTAKQVGLRTESAQRFEKGVDPLGVERALALAAGLMGGKLTHVTHRKKGEFKPKEIRYRVSRINQILGTLLSETEVDEILARLGIRSKESVAQIPSYRADLSEEIDLIEEVARIYGYNNIEKRVPHCSTSVIPSDPVFLFENEMRNRLVGAGLNEFLTCDLISPFLAEIGSEIAPELECLKTAYSKSEEYSVLRTTLLPGLMQVVKGNFAQKNRNLAAFEIGRIHFLQNKEVVEIPMVAILLTGNRALPHWNQKSIPVDFFDLKGILENFVPATFAPSNLVSMHPGRQAEIRLDDLVVGSMGELHPRLLEKFGIDEPVYYAELNLLHLLKKKKSHLQMAALPQFPSSERDLTLTLPIKKPIVEVFDQIRSLALPLLEKVELIDLYLPEGQDVKNATFRFTYRDLLKTISFEEVEAEHAKVLNLLAK